MKQTTESDSLNVASTTSTQFPLWFNSVKSEYHKCVVGQEKLLERLTIALIGRGHILLEGVPGLAKTLAVKTFASILGLQFNRIQFTSDLLPSDILGIEMYNQHTASFSLKKGPLFSNIVLADEINRSPSKVQSALLEVMQEKQITIGGTTFPLSEPYLVMATQNPMEQDGTYPLPEAQIDRFMLKIAVDYPTKADEIAIVKQQSQVSSDKKVIKKLLSKEDIFRYQSEMNDIYIDDKILDYIVTLVEATRAPEKIGIDKNLVAYGASPRASIYLTIAAKSYAYLYGKNFVSAEDVKEVAMDVLRHRLIVSYEAEAENITAKTLVTEIISKVKTP